MKVYELLDTSNPVFRSYIVWSSILVIKMLLMSTLTSIHRFLSQTFANAEDLVLSRTQEVKFGNETVERARRAHRNDMENILPYLTIALFYVLTDPPLTLATILFIAATVARILHSLVYTLVVVPQPARALCFFTQWGITIFMAIAAISHFI